MNNNSARTFIVPDEIIASNSKRFANFIIDLVMRIILSVIIVFIAGVISVLTDKPEMVFFFQELNRLEQFAIDALLLLIYYNFFEIFFATTVGKLITKTVVVDRHGEKPETNAILLRSISRLIPFEIFSFLGTPSVGWHDSLSKTYVVNKDELEEKKALFYSFEEIGRESNE